MTIKQLFARDVHRSINGVVKADQRDASSVWQELDEFVVTRELTGHIRDLVEVLLSSMQSDAAVAGKNGIWVAGFFGSGKSHLIKVLSYVLENEVHSLAGQHRDTVSFFEKKIEDPMLFADLKRIAESNTDTILFNIDSKADHKSGRDALLQVFFKVLNEKQGYSGDYLHIANMERHLEEKGRLKFFHDAYSRITGNSWIEERDAWEFHRDELNTALQEALTQSEDSVEKLLDGGEENFNLTVDNFASCVKRYLDRQGPSHHIMFLVDEVGQFIGSDSYLMLSLQTIAEKLSTVCEGRAWVVVTSQEDLDAVLGDLQHAKQHDFSKIQGRFKTRLTLSSRNVDEVIQKRLLEKKDSAAAPLEAAYEGKQDILKNQLSFRKSGKTYKTFDGAEDFAACYPFAAYQFTLVQQVFESIRKAGATGLHLSQGERSILDAFQGAAKQIGDRSIGALVPFYLFYPAVEGFLEGSVKRTIEQAAENASLQAFDILVLKVLFLIRYVDEMPGTVDNLVTLCVDEIDADRLALRRQIEESLRRLESETLVSRNDDRYFFLTNEERVISREIKSESIPSGGEARELGKLIFEDLMGDVRKHTYSLNKRDFEFTRICDEHPVGNKIDGAIEVHVVSPLGDLFEAYADDAKCIFATGEHGKIIIRLPDDLELGSDLRTYLQTETYVKTKNTGALPDTTKRILRDRSEENRERRKRISVTLRRLMEDADYFACGRQLDIQRTDPKTAVGEAIEYLIRNTFSKMGYIKHPHPNPLPEIQSILRANDVETLSLQLETEEANKQALDELREHINLATKISRRIVLYELINQRYGRHPYGWPENEVLLLVARLAVLKEIDLVVNAAPLPLEKTYDYLTSPSRQRQVIITLRESATGDLIKQAQALGKKLFAVQGPDNEEALFALLREKLNAWHQDFNSYNMLAASGKYPGKKEIDNGLSALRPLVEMQNSLRFLKRFVLDEEPLRALAGDVRDLQDFYTTQKHSWDNLQEAYAEFSHNRMQLEMHQQAGPALQRMKAILERERPYDTLHEAANLIQTVRKVNDRKLDQARTPALANIQTMLGEVSAALDAANADDNVRQKATRRLQSLLDNAQNTRILAHIEEALNAAGAAHDFAFNVLEEAQAQQNGTSPNNTATVIKKRRPVEIRSVWPTGSLETQEDIEAFLSALRKELEEAISAGERVQLR